MKREEHKDPIDTIYEKIELRERLTPQEEELLYKEFAKLRKVACVALILGIIACSAILYDLIHTIL